MKEEILSHLTAECPWRDTLHWYDTIDSTNTRAKTLAAEGAPHGTVVIAGHQSGGRGRIGRSFHSPAGLGVYLSVILRPNCKAEALMHLTCAVAVAMCDAAEQVTGFRPSIKWINDLVANRKKLGGILTELSVDTKTGLVQYAVVGIGINCAHKAADFPVPIRDIAISLETVTGKPLCKSRLAAAMICALWQMDKDLLTAPGDILVRYRKDCITLGEPVILHRGEEKRCGIAVDLDDRGCLVVDFEDGSRETVSSGEISIRGMWGYV